MESEAATTVATASSGIDFFLWLVPVILIVADWMYGRVALHWARKELDVQREQHAAQTKEYEECKQRCAEIAKELERVTQVVTKQDMTFLANDFRVCSMPSEVLPLCPNCFPEHRIYLQSGPGVGEQAPQELKDRFERDKKEGNAFATHYRCPVCKYESRLINKQLSEIQERVFREWPKPLGT